MKPSYEKWKKSYNKLFEALSELTELNEDLDAEYCDAVGAGTDTEQFESDLAEMTETLESLESCVNDVERLIDSSKTFS